MLIAMKKDFISFLILSVSCLSGCGADSNIGHGYEIIDGGGSKQSLAKDGSILINYTVTGFGTVGNYTVIEERPYDSTLCNYYVIDPQSRNLMRVNSASNIADNMSYGRVLEAVEAINQRSCRAS